MRCLGERSLIGSTFVWILCSATSIVLPKCFSLKEIKLGLRFTKPDQISFLAAVILPSMPCLMFQVKQRLFLQPTTFLFKAGVRYSQGDLSSADRRGLFWLLDEEAIFPGATDESFIERLLLQNTQRGSQVYLL